MENKLRQGTDPQYWRCASGNPSPAWHPNRTLFAVMRHNPCWRGHQTREHIALWRADDSWDGLWRPVVNEPLFGWGGGGPENCTDKTGCQSLEDPHLWWDKRGAHLMHSQNFGKMKENRGAYGWSLYGLQWHLETMPLISNTSAWSMHVQWTNGSASSLGR